MEWRYEIRGQHVHVEVFLGGANCGHLCFRIAEFESLKILFRGLIIFETETPWAVNCFEHGLRYLTKEEYTRQLGSLDALWKCPVCGEAAEWSDEVYEKAMESDPFDRTNETAEEKRERDADIKGDADMDKQRAGD